MAEEKCDYCGEGKREVTIQDPNDYGSLKTWDVCKECSEIIKNQQEFAFKTICELAVKKIKKNQAGEGQ